MGQRTLCGHGLAIWTTISANDIHGTGGCPGMGRPTDGGKGHATLLGQLPACGGTSFRAVQG